ncbi:MAG: hypothetical protein A2Y15_05140 [Clostridiales bacterium GWF2_36_10]|nr:MAG: hypothetical protein A2Y15_05140 [Clostridiales bacterium GWF2_36_10]HAN22154.1 hypothetical protein [Clostridiales bacterium]
MKKNIILFVSLALLLAITVFPVQAADKVINLIDEGEATWTNNEANGNAITVNFTDGKLIAKAPGSWPWVTAALTTPIVLSADDNATINLKFKVEDATACTSIRLMSGDQAIYLHHFVDGATYDGSGDITAGEYELSAKLFDLKAFAGTAEDVYLGKKDLVLDESGNLTIDGFQVWCSGASEDITVTVEEFEIVIPDNETSESVTSEESVVLESDTSESPTTGDNGFVGIIIIALVSLTFAAIVATKKRA